MQDKGFKLILTDSIEGMLEFSPIMELGHPLNLGDLFWKISQDVDAEFQATWEENARRGLIEDDMPYKGGMEKAKRRSALMQHLAQESNGEATYYILLEPKDAEGIRAANRSLVLSPAGKRGIIHGTSIKLQLPEAATFLARGFATIIKGEVDIQRRAMDVWSRLPKSFMMLEPKEVDEERIYACQSKGPTGFVTWISQDIDQIALVVTEGPTIRLVSYSPTNAFSKEDALDEVRRLYEDAPLVQLHEEFEDFQLHAAGCDPVKEIV